MPIDIKCRGARKDRPAEEMAKGKFGKSYANELFSQVNDFLYEFGIIGKQETKKRKDQDE